MINTCKVWTLFLTDLKRIRGSTHKWIASWLSKRYQRVAKPQIQSRSYMESRKDSVLGPVIFLIFFNDLPDNIRSSVCLFADDCVLYRNINSLTDSQIQRCQMRFVLMRLLFGIPIMKLRHKRWRKCRRQQPGGNAGDGGTGVASTICWTNSSGHPWRTQGEVCDSM